MRDQLGMAAVTDWTAWLSYPSPSIALWPDWFAAADSTWPAGLEPVGFIVDRENESAEIPRELQTFLEEGEPPILITGGTGLYLGSNFYEAAAEACRLLGYRGVLVTQHREQIPKYLPDGVLWVRDVPLTKLLARVAAVIHHGGRGTLSAAIAAGVPQLVLAMGADRPDNAIRLKQLGVADYLLPPGWQPARAAQKLQQLMRSEAVAQRCRTLAVQMAAADGAASACEIVERVLAGVGLPEGTPANGIELG
jgi:UDP:flavonoid glycosyltransferase YjiC (YdhE family)